MIFFKLIKQPYFLAVLFVLNFAVLGMQLYDRTTITSDELKRKPSVGASSGSEVEADFKGGIEISSTKAVILRVINNNCKEYKKALDR